MTNQNHSQILHALHFRAILCCLETTKYFLLPEQGQAFAVLQRRGARSRVRHTEYVYMQVTLDFKLELPQVAVVGSQSSGKSSVLEALVRLVLLSKNLFLHNRQPGH